MGDYGPDVYHLNVQNDGPLPLAHIVADPRIGFCILKFTQGTAYETGASWAIREGAKIRASRLVLGGYHMLDGDSQGDGVAQANYFLSKYNPQPGDIVPIVDFESSGQGSASLALYKARLREFVQTVNAKGFPVMLYGHSTVKAAYQDWRDSGAAYWWCPGSSAHNDVGPRGPDLWQYGPYVSPAGFPTDPLGTGQRTDMSKVLTSLPLIPEPTQGDDMSDYADGVADYLDHPDRALPLPDAWSQEKKSGYKQARQLVAAAVAAAPQPTPATGAITVSQGDQRYALHEHGHKGTVSVS